MLSTPSSKLDAYLMKRLIDVCYSSSTGMPPKRKQAVLLQVGRVLAALSSPSPSSLFALLLLLSFLLTKGGFLGGTEVGSRVLRI